MAQKKKLQLARKATREPRQRNGHKPNDPSKRQSHLWNVMLGLANDSKSLRQLDPFSPFKETPEQEERRRWEEQRKREELEGERLERPMALDRGRVT